MESGLREAALASPEFAFTDEQSLSEKAFGNSLRQLALMKLGLLDDEDLLDEVRMIQENSVLECNGEPDNIAELASDATERSERVFADGER